MEESERSDNEPLKEQVCSQNSMTGVYNIGFFQGRDYIVSIVREILHFGIFPAFPHFCENVPHFWLCSKEVCESANDSVT